MGLLEVRGWSPLAATLVAFVAIPVCSVDIPACQWQ